VRRRMNGGRVEVGVKDEYGNEVKVWWWRPRGGGGEGGALEGKTQQESRVTRSMSGRQIVVYLRLLWNAELV
jgi:hypothetical protein